jgi:hypothetical protein
MVKQISEQRKVVYYVGTGLQILGGLLFASVFVTGAMHFGDFSNFHANAKSDMFRGLGGMGLLIAGAVIRSIGARGLAGSGVILDPEEARRDLEPYSRMGGGMLKDALDEADIHIAKGQSENIVMVKCLSCGKLNEEDSRFCQQCGKPL